MREIILTILVAAFSNVATFSQTLNTYFRVQNYGSKHFIHIRDCYGSVNKDDINKSDMDAVELRVQTDDFVSDPSSIVYISYASGTYDVISQNTGINAITGMTPELYYIKSTSSYQIYYSGQYLYDIGSDKTNMCTEYSAARTYLGIGTSSEFSNKNSYRSWTITEVNSSTSNYFGFKPSVSAGGKYYAPFFADFAYSPIEGNVKTWYVSQIDTENAIAVVSQIVGTVSKSQAVFVECANRSASGNKVNLTTDEGNPAAANNMLKGTYFCNGERVWRNHKGLDNALVEFDSNTMRVLGTGTDGSLAFVSTTENLTPTDIYSDATTISRKGVYCIPANTSYLTVPSGCPATLKVMTEEEYKAFIESQSLLLGDVNGDKKVTITDVTCALRFITKDDTTGLNEKAADINGDGKVTISDIPALVDKVINKK